MQRYKTKGWHRLLLQVSHVMLQRRTEQETRTVRRKTSKKKKIKQGTVGDMQSCQGMSTYTSRGLYYSPREVYTCLCGSHQGRERTGDGIVTSSLTFLKLRKGKNCYNTTQVTAHIKKHGDGTETGKALCTRAQFEQHTNSAYRTLIKFLTLQHLRQDFIWVIDVSTLVTNCGPRPTRVKMFKSEMSKTARECYRQHLSARGDGAITRRR